MTKIRPTLAPWKDVPQDTFDNHAWQDKHSIFRIPQLEEALQGTVPTELIGEITSAVRMVNMAIRLTPYVMELIDWNNLETDPIRRQFLPILSELEPDHSRLVVDSLREQKHSPVTGLVHRYPDKVLFLATSVCPVYCQFCTRSYAVGGDTPQLQKEKVASTKNWDVALDYIRENPEIEDVVVSGGDSARLKPANLKLLGNALLDIPHVRRIRFATKALAVQPMKFVSDTAWVDALVEIVSRGRDEFKHVCIHTHFNHPREVTPIVEQAMRQLHQHGIFVRNQTVLLRGVNDDAATLRDLIKKLGRVNIHPYYAYLCDMVKGTEHFRLALHEAQKLEKEVRGSTAGFNTPLFIVDTPAGKRDVHSWETYDRSLGVSSFAAPAVSNGTLHHYYDPIRSLLGVCRDSWTAEADMRSDQRIAEAAFS
jgi:lysine 2,3-aminomutase